MLKRIIIASGLLIFVFLTLSCAQVEDKATNSSNTSVAEIVGLIEDGATGNPIADVQVTIEGRSQHVYTNSDGEFTLYVRPRGASGEIVWQEDIGLLFNVKGYSSYKSGSSTVSFGTAYTVTIERGRTSAVRLEFS